jgi:hypothetical protein
LRYYGALAAFLSLVFAAGCGGGDLVLPEDQVPVAITVVEGNGQVGPVGAELADPLLARVLDAQERPVPGVRVAFKLGSRADGGDTSPDTAVTNADGLASSRWVLGGNPGRQEVQAEVVGTSVAVTFSAEAEQTSEYRLEMVSGDAQEGAAGAALPEPLVVRLVDESGDGVPDQPVAWVVAIGGGTAAPQSSSTDAQGLASTTWTLGAEAGLNTLNAVVSGVGVVSFTATGVAEGGGEPSPERSGVSASPTDIAVGTGISTITVTVRDESGAAVSGATVSLAATGGGNILTQPSAPTGADGVATGTLQSALPGTKVVSAVVNGSIGISETAAVTVSAVPQADRLRFLVQPTDTPEDETISPAVEVAVVDQQGDVVPVSGVEIEIKLIKSDGHDSKELKGERKRDTQDGVAVFPDLVVNRDDSDYRLRASAPGRPELGTVDSEPFDIED